MLNLNTDTVGQHTNWQLEGTMTLSDLSLQWPSLSRRYPSTKEWCIDLSTLTHCDSAALAFLLACLRHTRKNAIQLTLDSPSPDLLALMNVQGLKDIFKDCLKS